MHGRKSRTESSFQNYHQILGIQQQTQNMTQI
jgi:hypothetical protein